MHEDLGVWFSSEDIQAKVVQIFSESWHVIEEREGGIAQELYLEPGTYHLEIECSAFAGFLLQRVTVQLEASKRYIAYCIADLEKGALGQNVPERALAAVSEEGRFESDKNALTKKVQSSD